MGVGFGMLFQGMAIQRMFGGLAKSIMETYSLAMGENSTYTNGVNQVAGAWEFLKFSIMDALVEAGTVDWIIEKLIWMSETIAGMPPWMRELIGKTILFGFALGTVAMILGQLSLSALAILETMTLLKGISFAPMAASLKGIGAAMLTPVGIIGAGVAALLSFVGLLMLAKTYTDNWGDAFKLFGWSVVRAFQIIVKWALTALNPIILLIDSIIRLSNKFLGTNFEAVGPKVRSAIDSAIGGDYVQQQINQLMALNQARKDMAMEQNQIDLTRAMNPTPASPSNTTITNNITVARSENEDRDAYIEKLMRELEQMQMKNSGSTAT